MDPSEHLPLSPRDFLILLALAEGPLHGYGILAAVERRGGDEVRLDPANLYRSLKRLRRDGMVEEADPPSPTPAPPEQRRYFRLTDHGRQVAAAEAERLAWLARVAREVRLIGEEETAAG
jgi:DNA-binding PadR family transcriptional regulator